MLNFLYYLLLTLGALVVILIVIVLAVAFYYRKTIRMLIGGYNQQIPARIHLKKADSLKWRNKKLAMKFDKELKELGFKPIGKYTIKEMPKHCVKAFRKPGEPFYAVIYEGFLGVEPIVDLDAIFPDGFSLGVSVNYPKELEADTPEFVESYKIAKPDIKAGLKLFHEKLAEKSEKPTLPKDFVNYFEVSYAREMDWRATRGPNMDEIRRIAESSIGNAEASSQVLADVYMEQEARNQLLLEECLIARLKELGLMKGLGNWNPDPAGNLIIHEKRDEDFLDGVAVDYFNFSGKTHVESWKELLEREKIPTYQSIREQFRTLAEMYGKEARITFKVTVPEPIEADFWSVLDEEDY